MIGARSTSSSGLFHFIFRVGCGTVVAMATVAVLSLTILGLILAGAFRGELKQGEHAEYTLLEGKLANEQLAPIIHGVR